jgi:DNA-binding beta-propeller fold protein YncE
MILRKVLVIAAALAAATIGQGWSGRGGKFAIEARTVGEDRIVSMVALPEEGGDLCEVPAARPARQASAAASQEGRPGGTRAAVEERQPLRVITDPDFSFAGIAVDPIRNEVVMADENISAIVVYDRLANTPPGASRSEPKRVIQGDKTFIEFASSVYIDPETGDIYNVNNDTMNWMPVFGREATGNVPPKRALQTPHTTHGIAVDEQARELFLTIQDDHAVVVFDKHAKDPNPESDRRSPSTTVAPPSPLRILQGRRTQMADPHGIALDTRRGEIVVTNWGTGNDRPALGTAFGGGSVNRRDFPVGRRLAFRGSGTIQPPSITVYAKDARGDTPPLRVIQGPSTRLNWPTSVAVHPGRGELFIANDVNDEVLVFRADATGNAAPTRIIKGSRSGLRNPTGVAVDLRNNELWVANLGNHTATAYRIDAAGDASPVRVIRSAPIEAQSPMLSNAHTVTFDSKRDELLVAS